MSDEEYGSERKEEKKTKALRLAYRRVFCTPEGEIVLADMLNDLHLLDMHIKPGGKEEELSNYGKMLLWKIGPWQGFNLLGIVQSLLRLPYQKLREDKNNG